MATQTAPPSKSTTTLKKSHRTRNILIFTIVLAFSVVIGGLYFQGLIPGVNNFDFILSGCDPNNGNALQGETIQTSITVTLKGGPAKQVVLSITGSPSGVTCSLGPQSGVPPFSCSIAIGVSSSVPSAAYSIMVVATSGNIVRSSTFTLSVLSSQIKVSGKVITLGGGTTPTNIIFVSEQTGQVFTTKVTTGLYSLMLPNEQNYRVTVQWEGMFGSTGSFDGGILAVDIDAGRNSLSQNFTG